MSVLPWPALKPGELPLVVVLSVLIIVALLNFRSPRKWVDMLLLLALAGTGDCWRLSSWPELLSQ